MLLLEDNDQDARHYARAPLGSKASDGYDDATALASLGIVDYSLFVAPPVINSVEAGQEVAAGAGPSSPGWRCCDRSSRPRCPMRKGAATSR